ncbi:uncharacterized protein LOC119589699 [Penaeus monodon]|uniref:uncharacterized protein LOC119589699 n=1 Tax=Penaeus monodon TaxID=6687 RepID=UPI0018A7A7ED|nr:uncharacterized protein LOC119589699 [Penaeus monodon]
MTCLMSSMRREKGKLKRAGHAKVPGPARSNPEWKFNVSPWFAFKSLQFLWEKDKPREIGTITEREQEQKVCHREEDQLTLLVRGQALLRVHPIPCHKLKQERRSSYKINAQTQPPSHRMHQALQTMRHKILQTLLLKNYENMTVFKSAASNNNNEPSTKSQISCSFKFMNLTFLASSSKSHETVS